MLIEKKVIPYVHSGARFHEQGVEEEEEEEEISKEELNGIDPKNLNSDEEKSVALAVTDDTEIEVNGEKIKVGELKQGYQRQSDYTKKMQELAKERETIKSKEKTEDKEDDSDIPENDRKTAKYLLKIALEDPELKKEFGIITEKELATREAVQQLSAQSEKMAKEYDGKNGLPKFEEKEILQLMHDEGIRNMQTAYNVKYSDEISDWKASQKKGNTSYKTEGKGAPIQPKKKQFANSREGQQERASSILDEMLGDKI
jgi:hypothetical protein